jgi:Bacterial flagellin N-terminal helical region
VALPQRSAARNSENAGTFGEQAPKARSGSADKTSEGQESDSSSWNADSIPSENSWGEDQRESTNSTKGALPMAISILNNIASIAAQNQLSVTNARLNSALLQLSSGSRINSGADAAAGLAVADGLQANITALTQSSRNANDGVGYLQVVDGSLA